MKNPDKSRKCKKPYVYFDNLTFLSDGSKAQREDNNEDDELNGEEDDDSEHTDYSIEQQWIKEEDDLSRKTIKQYPDQSPSDTNNSLGDTSSTEAMYVFETVAVEDNSARPADSDSEAREGRCCSYFCETDEDRLFLLSLVSELKQVPRDLKLDAKMEIMNLIKTYKSKINSSL